MYILFAFLALFSSVGNTIFNRISSNKVGSVLSSTIKSFMITFACFIICACFGHVKVLYALTNEQWLWVGVLSLVTVVDWLFYFLAIKRAHLEAFAPFESSYILFISNLLFVIFMVGVVTSGGSALNIVLFVLGLAFLLGSTLYAALNKKINPSKKVAWIIYSLISGTALAFTLVIVKIKLQGVHPDVIAFHQMLFVFGVSFIVLLFSKDKKEIKHLNLRTYVNFLISAVFNALLMVFRYMAFASEHAIPSIINVIVGLDFVFVSIATVLFFKEKNKKQLVNLIILIVIGMVLITLPAVIK